MGIHRTGQTGGEVEISAFNEMERALRQDSEDGSEFCQPQRLRSGSGPTKDWRKSSGVGGRECDHAQFSTTVLGPTRRGRALVVDAAAAEGLPDIETARRKSCRPRTGDISKQGDTRRANLRGTDRK